jgi:hypothetical protein
MTKKKNPEELEKRGRKTVMTPEIINKLEQAFSMGCSDLEACLFADIGKTTLYNYQNENPEFVERKEKLKEKLVLKARTVIAESLNKQDENTAKWYLERKAKNEFSTKVENETTLNLPETALVIWK